MGLIIVGLPIVAIGAGAAGYYGVAGLSAVIWFCFLDGFLRALE